MDEQECGQRIAKLESKIDALYVSSERMRKYFLWTAIITLAVLILPLVGLLFAIPSFLSSYSSTLGGF